MTKKTIEQLESMIHDEGRRLEQSFAEDIIRNSHTMSILSERVRALEHKDSLLSISKILAKAEFCPNNIEYNECSQNKDCSTCIYDFLHKRLGDISNEKKGSGNT